MSAGVVAAHYVATVAATGYAAAVMADAPAGYWRLGDRAAGTTAADSSGNAGPLTYKASSASAASLLAADATDAATTAGTDGVASAIPSAAVNNSSGTLTLEAWVKINGTGSQNIMEQGEAGNTSSPAHFWLIADRPNNRFVFGWNDGNWRDHYFGYTFTTGATLHVVAVAEGTTARIYVNGAQVGTGVSQIGAPVARTGQTLGLGYNPRTNANYLSGVLDEVAIYDTALTAARVSAHYTAGTTG